MVITLLGGGKLLLKIAEEYANSNELKKINVITSKRHSIEKINGSNFKKEFQRIEKNDCNDKLSLSIINNLDDYQFEKKTKNSDLAISFGAAWIFKKRHLEICKNLVNIHCTPLPMWRGGGGMSWMILAGINYSHITIHEIDEGVDTGDILLSKKFFFPVECRTPKEHTEFIQNLSFSHLKLFINDFIKKGSLPSKSRQQDDFSSYFPRLNSSIHGCIDWSWDSRNLVRFINAFDDPYCGAFCNLAGKKERVFLKKVIMIGGESDFHPFQSGIIFRKDEKGLYICGNQGSIFCSSLSNFEGDNIMEEISVGDRFYSKFEDLEKAKSTKTIYTSEGLFNI